MIGTVSKCNNFKFTLEISKFTILIPACQSRIKQFYNFKKVIGDYYILYPRYKNSLEIKIVTFLSRILSRILLKERKKKKRRIIIKKIQVPNSRKKNFFLRNVKGTRSF